MLLGFAASVAHAQSPLNGSLAGKLTDLHSRPLEGATVVLRNRSTGTETRTITTKNGAYRFSSLPPGDYSLEAGTAQLGHGFVQGIVVASGHEAHVQAALELDRQPPEPLVAASLVQHFTSPASVPPASIPPASIPVAPSPASQASAPLLPGIPRPPEEKPSTASVMLETAFASEPMAAMQLSARSGPWSSQAATPLSPPPPVAKQAVGDSAPRDPAPALSPRSAAEQQQLAALTKPLSPAGLTGGVAAGVVLPHLRAAQPLAMIAGGTAVAIAAALTAQSALNSQSSRPRQLLEESSAISPATDPTTVTLTGEQLQEIPLAGRRWENFLLNSQGASGTTDRDDQGGPSTTRGATTAVTVDGATTQLAFGSSVGTSLGSSLIGPGRNEAAIQEVQTSGQNGDGEEPGGGRVSFETRRGGQSLHGQGFLFERQNLWGAKNPLTQWLQETAPATLTTTPVFTPRSYTPPNQDTNWGFGLGGPLLRKRLFWFAALDANQRNDPGVSSVKHPDHFFAQPSNDEMQVLSARLGLGSINPVAEGLAAYSGMLESLGGLLGPASRTATQWIGSGRLDWNPSERHRYALEGSGTQRDSPGGGLSRASESFGNRSFGASRVSETWLLGRWEAFLTPNLLAVTQGSMARHILAERPGTPSAFEQSLNASAWGQLPQMVVDGSYGMTIGAPARFGSGRFPDEHVFAAQEGLDWVRDKLLIRTGFSLSHNADSTSMVRNHAGTYYYSNIENFASDALVFATFGLADALDPMNQHNCDQRGKAWRDSTGQLHGLGNLPCYSYYSQTMGPTDWHLSTNDWAGYVTAQWQPGSSLVLSASLRWERQQLPPPIAAVNNPDLPLTQKLPGLGNNLGPRVSLAWGSGAGYWPVLRLGYGMYFGRTNNAAIETALTQTGSLKGDLNFYMRPTDNLNAGGAPPFPYVLSGQPTTVQKPGAVEFAPHFRNPEVHQAVTAVEETLPGRVLVSASAAVSLGRRLPVTFDTNFDPAVNPGTITYTVVDGTGKGPIKTPQITVPFFASWPSSYAPTGFGGRLNPHYQQITEIFSSANSTYEAAMLRIARSSRRGLGLHALYTYAHAMDWNPNESVQVMGSEVLDPNNLAQEYGASSLDVRHSVSSMLIWQAPWRLHSLAGRLANGWMFAGTGQFRTGLPYSMRTAGSIPQELESSGAVIVGLGPGMNGYGGDNRVYGVGRNTYRYPGTWKADVRLGKKFSLGETRELQLMAESFNLFNHQNVTRIETTGYSIRSGGRTGSLPTLNFLTGLKTGQVEFGQPLDVNATDFFRERQIDFGLRMSF